MPHGGALRNGGTNKGGPGRPPDEFKAMCARLASRNATANRVREILEDKDHPFFMNALKWATENGYGKPTEHVEVDAKMTHYVVNAPAKGANPEAWQRQYNRN